MPTTIRFNIQQGLSKSMMKYHIHFNEATIKDVHPNQEMFVGVFHNLLKVGHFNASLCPKVNVFISNGGHKGRVLYKEWKE